MVFEEQVAYYLDKYLGKFVRGLSKEALKISVWQGNVELTNMQLKPEALNALKLPVKVKAGFLGSVKLKVPWSRLGQEPVVVLLDRIFLLAEPATSIEGQDGDAVQEAKMTRVTEAERKLVEAKGEEAMKEDVNNSSWLGSLISTIIGNLKLSISNIHVRYEDTESHPGHAFSGGLTLEKLAAVTVDENGKETFVTGGSLDRIQKVPSSPVSASVPPNWNLLSFYSLAAELLDGSNWEAFFHGVRAAELQRLAVYFDPDTEPWTSPRKWEDLSPTEWAEIFVPGIKSDTAETDGKAAASGAGKLHSYVLKPIGGNARYFKLASKDQRTPEKPAQKATVLLKDVTVGVSEDQYRDVLKVVENFSTFNKRLQYAHYRPSVPITEDRRGWWQYAVKAVTEEWKRASGHVSWKRVLTLSVVRKKYLSLYISALQSASPDQISITNNKEIRDMDRELDTDVIIQWRLMAHTYVDENRAKDQKRRQQQNRGWWPFGWGGSGNEEQESKFSEEDLEKLNEIIGYRSGEQSNVLPGEDPPNMLHTLLEVHMQHNATKLVAHDGEELLDVSSDDLHVVLHMYPKTIKFDLKLDSYKVGCPEGLLAESASIKEAVTATFTYLPLDIENGGTKDSGQKLDWSFAAKASPLYVTVLMPSINKVTKFFQSSKAVSRSVALDTATALQSTLDEVTKNAQQQINNALKDRPRFSIDLDLAAPKITIPTDFRPDGVHECNLLVDLGYFSLQTELEDDGTLSSEEQELYMRFKMRLTDVSAILADGEHDWKNQDEIYANLKERKENARREKYLPLLEKCGMLLAVQQICVPHPLYPSTRVALKLPSLGFHISPSRYHRLMQIMKVFQSDSKDDEVVRPWEPSDFEGKISVLAWKGVGHREAVWQQRYAVLTGPFIYILENPSAQSYKYCSSIIGKQVTIVPPGSMGDIPYVLAVCDAGQFNNKVAESVSALILRFDDESIMNGWHSRLMGAIYRMSAPAAVASLMSSRNEGDQENAMVATSQANEKSNVSEQESIFVVGELDELKIIISNGQQGNNEPTAILLEPESPLLEFRAIGTKVEFVQRKFDMSVGLVLQVLEIEDKFYGHISPSCKYLARSNIESSKSSSAPRIQKRPSLDGGPSQRKPLLHPSQGRRSLNRGKRVSKERRLSATERDRFFDATEELEAEGPTARLKRNSNSGLEFFDAEELGAEDPPTFKRTDGLLPVVSGAGKEQHKTRDEVLRDFVKVQAIVSSQESPNYSNIDKQVTVSLATLSFFSNRRTLLALMDLVSAITAEVVPKDDDDPAPASTESDAVVSTINPKAIGDNEDVDESQAGLNRNESVVKGLLGKGKSRLIFLVTMKMDRAQIVLNTEDGAQLSVLSIADLRTEVKVFPSSFGIKATLGNLQVSDGSLDDNHPYHYLCNMRDPEGESFIQLEFLSFNKEDDDYEGFEYSIMGKLSEVRIVYLNRFIQEIVGYLMGLVPQSSDYVVKLKDKVTDVDTYISQSEIEGQPAMKLGLSLNKPVIIMPRATSSDDFLELDILHINLYNTFQWLGGDEKELGAVRLETTTLELEDLHLVVGLGGKTGEGIIQEARGLALTLRRPIRDLWHQLPVAEASIKIDELRAALSDQEYQLITECATSNINETPNLLPPVVEVAPENDGSENGKAVETVVQESGTPENDSAEAEDSGGSTREAWTTVKVGVDIEKVELGLYSGGSRQSPLASIQVAGVWASYKSNTIQESNVQATLKKFSVRDDREGTQAEMRYMIGNADDNESSAAGKMVEGFEEEDGGDQADKDKAMAKSAPCDRPGCTSAMTMLVMDAKLSPNLQMVSLRIQRPRLLVALDFLLAVAEFFVPSMHAMRSDGKGDENPLEIQNAIMLTEKVYVQSAKEVILSPKRPLVADVEGLTTYTYDGRGGSIRLLDREQADLRDFSQEVVILIGDGKKLIFKDVVIQNGDYLDSCISLGTNSSYSASEHDGVFLEGQPEHRVDVDRQKGQEQNEQNELARSDKGGEDKPAVELIFDLQAVSPELTFYDSLAKAAESVLLPERILRARLNIFSRFILKGEDMELNAQVNGMVVEAGSGVQVVEPVDMIVKYTSFAGSQKVVVASSEIHANFSFSTIQLILRLQTDVMSFLRITSEQTTVECSQFDKVWANDDESEGANCITFWRPRAPPGFAILGDCMTPRDELPSKGVIAVNMSLARVKRPVEMVRLWSSDQVRPPSVEGTSDEDDDSNNLCSVWLPVPPPGYVALGCVANPGKRPPPLNTSFCVLAPLVALCGMKDCINITSQIRNEEGESEEWSFWRVDNSTGSFFMGAAVNPPYNYRPYELRQVIAHYESFPVQETKPNHASNQDSTQDGSSVHDSSSSTRERILPTLSLPSGRIYENVARFTLVWWDKGSGSSRGVSIWRPVVPSECVILGDVAIEGYEPPSSGVVMHDLEETGLLIKPTSFKKMDQLPRKRGLEGVSFYLPVAPSGYVSLGCVAGVGSSPGAEDLVRCIRSDLVIGSNFTTSSLWKTSETKYKKQELSIWPVENEASTFIVGRGFKHPPRRLALGLADLKKPDAPDNLSVDAKFDQISATVCDDFGGLMAPLLDVSVSDIFLNVRGRTEALSCSLKFSASATTFNGKYSAWEPLIEPLEGHVRYEFTSYPSEEARPTESKLRLTASSALNVNVSTANVNMLLEAYASWNRFNQMEESSNKSFSIDSRGRTNSKSALSAKTAKTLSCMNHNELGEELFLRIVEHNQPKVLSLASGGTVAVKLPSAQIFQDPKSKATRRKRRYQIVAIRIGDAEIPREGGIGGREYMLAIRIVPRSQTADQQQLQYQSARTRCVAPDDGPPSKTVKVHWDEVFIFEIEPQEGNVAEVVVTDLSKGTPLGYMSMELQEDDTNSTKLRPGKTFGSRLPLDSLALKWSSLYPVQGAENTEGDSGAPCGQVSFGKHFFSPVGNPTKELELDATGHEFGTFQVGPARKGPWASVGLNYALGPAPFIVNDDLIASEFYVDEGVKHLVLRSLVGVQNGTDIDVEVSLCMRALLEKSLGEEFGANEYIGENVEEECFENERYQPVIGWGSKWPGYLLPTDPAHYSARDFTKPSVQFPEVKLPLGWEWSSDWHVDKVPGGDQDGWGYGFDFRSLDWPPHSAGRATSFVRRRRWIRTRKSVAEGGPRVMLGVLQPAGKLSLPIASLRESSVNYFLQIRPKVDHGPSYEWSQVTSNKGYRDRVKPQGIKEISVRALVETEELLSCSIASTSSSVQAKDVWFFLESSCTVIGKDEDLDPIKEWKLVITSSMMLRNHLPVPCEYSVSEKTSGKRLIVRDRGVLNPGDAAAIFHADVRKAIYLTWLPKGGWNPQKECVLISHPHRQPADRIAYSNTRTSRPLEVMIDHDDDEKGVAAKVLKFYVPCWLDSSKCPPLRYRIMEILQRDESKIASRTDSRTTKVPFEGVIVGNVAEELNFEERNGYPIMLSDVDFKTMGLSVAITTEGPIQFGPLSPLQPLNDPDGSLELRGLAEEGSCFRFLVSTESTPFDFAKSKVIRIRPYVLFTNRLGESLYLKQPESEEFSTLLRSNWRVSFPSAAIDDQDRLQVRLDGHEWSRPFSIESEASLTIALRKKDQGRTFIRVSIRSYEEGSRFSIVFRLGSTHGPYRMENRTADYIVKFRQLGLEDSSWEQLKPHSTLNFTWEDPRGERLLELLPANAESSSIIRYDIDKVGDHPDLVQDVGQTVSIRVVEILDIKTIRIYNRLVDAEEEEEEIEAAAAPNAVDSSQRDERLEVPAATQMEIVISIGIFGLSVINQHPREILYLSLDNVNMTYQMGFGDRISRFKLRIGYLQLDNQLPLSWMPVLLAPEGRLESEFLLKFSLVMYDAKAADMEVYPYIGFQVENTFRINVHEPIIWAIVDMYNNIHLDRLSDDSNVVQVDPEVKIDLIDLSEVRLKLTLETASAARPRGMLGVWSPLVTTLGNTTKMPIHLGSVVRQSRYVRKSMLSTAIVNRIRRDLIHQPLQLLSGVDVLGMTSSTLGTLSQGAAQLSRDGTYLRLRSSKDRSRNISGVGEGLLQGTEALARGFGYGLSGVVTKPVSNAKRAGFTGFFKGVGKAALGVVMLPVSGILDFVSLTVNGVGVTCTSCFEIFDRDSRYQRRRLPRALRGGSVLYTFDFHDAAGLAILQLAQSGSFISLKGVFSEPAEFAMSDTYEAHFELPKNRILMLTNKRILMLGRPKSHFQNPDKTFTDPTSVLWKVSWKNLLAVERIDHDPSIVLHLRSSTKTFARRIRCQNEDPEDLHSQRRGVFTVVNRLWKEYGPDKKSLLLEKRKRNLSARLRPRLRSKTPSSPRDKDNQERRLKFANSNSGNAHPVGRFAKDVVAFEQIWSSEREATGSCCGGNVSGELCTIWRAITPEGYVSVGDIARIGLDSPPVAITYRNDTGVFALPQSYDLVWRNWQDGFTTPISIWKPVPLEGYVAVGCVAMASYMEPDPDAVWCVREDFTEVTSLEAKEVWHAPNGAPWRCLIYPVVSDSLSFMAIRDSKRISNEVYYKVKAPDVQ